MYKTCLYSIFESILSHLSIRIDVMETNIHWLDPLLLNYQYEN
ncbi:hypothetical protein Bccel_0447 [Pseudobacteroides cellulosolvens ATCC 35603 = DSM 2933]|uniref:Uncharacterized protein n=1 Tax=Pseudobacteroides cellulosolvens ATCC 35603 = DSM 2933 TaxID=398512 RepID=A0A0L6JHK0_9FIRM|nr:hypothetical protein Bccel_0447 [Pseudobacteroides cellulosolvens ATCC 35603 = DSM 2933]